MQSAILKSLHSTNVNRFHCITVWMPFFIHFFLVSRYVLIINQQTTNILCCFFVSLWFSFHSQSLWHKQTMEISLETTRENHFNRSKLSTWELVLLDSTFKSLSRKEINFQAQLINVRWLSASNLTLYLRMFINRSSKSL